MLLLFHSVFVCTVPSRGYFIKAKQQIHPPNRCFSDLSQVTVSTTRGAWVLSRVFEHGYPWDVVFNTRLMSLIRNNLPGPLAQALINYTVNKRFNHENYGLQPEKRYFLVVPIPHGVTGLVLHTGRFPTATNAQTGVISRGEFVTQG